MQSKTNKLKSRNNLKEHVKQNLSLKFSHGIGMSQLFFGSLLLTPAPTAPFLGITFFVLFAIAVIMIGPDYDEMNAPTLKDANQINKDWFSYSLPSESKYWYQN